MATEADCTDTATCTCAQLKNLGSVVFEEAGVVLQVPLHMVRWVAVALPQRVQSMVPLHRIPLWWGK